MKLELSIAGSAGVCWLLGPLRRTLTNLLFPVGRKLEPSFGSSEDEDQDQLLVCEILEVSGYIGIHFGDRMINSDYGQLVCPSGNESGR